VGTTKLTRKEIVEDPIHDALIGMIEFLQANRKWIGIGAAAIVVVGLVAFWGIRYLDSRENEIQRQLTRGIEFYHAKISSDEAPEAGEAEAGEAEAGEAEAGDSDSVPAFGSEKEKYEAAAREFSSVASRRGQAKISMIARYYLGLTQLQLEQNKEAIRNLETVAGNSRNRTLGFLAQKVLAAHYLGSENYQEAGKILESMINDPQCDLPKDDLSLKLSQALVAQGKRDEAIAVLADANTQGTPSDPFKQKVAQELDRLQRAANTGPAAKTLPPAKTDLDQEPARP